MPILHRRSKPLGPRILAAVAMLGFAAFPSAASHAQEGADPLIQVILDDSGALQKAQQSLPARKALFGRISGLRSEPAWQDAQVVVITVNRPRVAWEGTIEEVKRNARDLLSVVTTENGGCAGLVEAFERAERNLDVFGMPAKNRLYVFSSLFHTGYPCKGDSISPGVPDELDLKPFKEAGTRLYFLWAYFANQNPWSDHLQSIGIRARVRNPSQTQTFLDMR